MGLSTVAVMYDAPFNHHASAACRALFDGDSKFYKSLRKADLFFPAEFIGQDACRKLSSVVIDASDLVEDGHVDIARIHSALAEFEHLGPGVVFKSVAHGLTED